MVNKDARFRAHRTQRRRLQAAASFSGVVGYNHTEPALVFIVLNTWLTEVRENSIYLYNLREEEREVTDDVLFGISITKVLWAHVTTEFNVVLSNLKVNSIQYMVIRYINFKYIYMIVYTMICIYLNKIVSYYVIYFMVHYLSTYLLPKYM